MYLSINNETNTTAMKITIMKDPYSNNFIAYAEKLGIYGYGSTKEEAQDNLIAILRD